MEQEELSSNEPTGYDEARVAQLRPLREAIERLPIPPLRSRKISGILNALEMQIEDGGDSPEVNRLLREDLRLAIHHQVDERQGQAALQALDAFELAEAKRCDPAKTLRLPTGSPKPAEKPEPAPPRSQDAAPARRPGRNAPCWCGSGKKYKKCHLRADEEARPQ